MKTFLRRLSLAVVPVLVALPAGHAQNLVINGGFESLDAGTAATLADAGRAELHATPFDDPYHFATGWFTQTQKVYVNQSGTLGVTTADGGNFVTVETFWETAELGHSATATYYFKRQGGLRNTFVSLVAGQSYTLSLDYMLVSSDAERTQVGIALMGYDGSGPQQVVTEGTTNYYFAEGPTSVDGLAHWEKKDPGEWIHYELTFVADYTADYSILLNLSTSTTHYLQDPAGIANSVLAFDNVSVTAVPEPAAFAALAGLGALGLAATRRRRAGRSE